MIFQNYFVRVAIFLLEFFHFPQRVASCDLFNSRNVIFDEADPEFQQYASFNTTIDLRNAFQDEMLNDDRELVLITLKRPLFYIQPVAIDKAILVWLNYKNAYEYWADKRANLNKDATGNMFDKTFQHLGSSNLSTLFLQLTVEDMGICLPLNQLPIVRWIQNDPN